MPRLLRSSCRALRPRGRIEDGENGGAIAFDLTLTPDPGAFYPPIDLDQGGSLGLGYVIAVLRGRWEGWIMAGGERRTVTGYAGYHDHNWGTWGRVAWDWGQVIGPDLALFYGGVRGPGLPARNGFLVLTNAEGILQAFRFEEIERRDAFVSSDPSARMVRIPGISRFVRGRAKTRSASRSKRAMPR
jgi:hypothetical protein